jgi:hypothetical protein
MARRSAKIIPMPIRQRLVCSECGADGEGTCRCGAPYVPAGQRAADAVAKNPEKSNRAIADEIGVDEKTVRKVRSTADQSAVEERTGKDGKTRKMPKAAPPVEPPTEEEVWQQTLMEMAGATIALPATMVREYGKPFRKFATTTVMITLAEQAAAAWQQIATDLKGRKCK